MAFYTPYGRKYKWLIMPFSLRNCPIIFIAMMHDMKERWEEYCSDHGIDPSIDKEGSTIILWAIHYYMPSPRTCLHPPQQSSVYCFEEISFDMEIEEMSMVPSKNRARRCRFIHSR
eukprot:scaffold45180_cov63-Attheya_sp.AAC.1